MRNIIALLLIIVFIVIGFISIKGLNGYTHRKTADFYIKNSQKETGTMNIVTSIVVNFRGFDTLGEVTVLFLASLGIGFLFHSKSKYQNPLKPSVVLNVGTKLAVPFFVLIGIYIILHGHLTPGGGFQGGTVIASAILLLFLGLHGTQLKLKIMEVFESITGMSFIIIGLIGIYSSGYFLANFMNKGILGNLISSGTIFAIYIVIGIKVGVELSKILGDIINDEV